MQDFENKKYDLLAGALLHDIGKVVQRSKNKERNKRHEILGGNFLKELGNFENNIILKCVEKHHAPNRDKHKEYIKNLNDPHVLITILSDHLSSSEREKEDNQKNKELINIFSNLFEYNENKNIDNSYSSKFTYGQIPTSENYNRIVKKLKLIKYIDLKNNVNKKEFEKLFYFYMKNTAFVPAAAYITKPDISLWDHSKTTCAISCCLYNIYKKGEINENDLKNMIINNEKYKNESLLSLIHGDLSGIQNFIFDIKTKGAIRTALLWRG